MTETYEILETILKLINEDLGLSFLCQAIKAYDTKNLQIPIKMTCFTVACEENKVTYFENESLEACEKNTVKIRINCFAPLRRVPYMSHALSETVMDFVCDYFMPQVTNCTIGNTEYDDEVKAYKISCYMTLEYERCAAEGTQNEELNTASNLFCKSHLNDENIHVSETDRVYLNEPYVIGSYVGNGTDDFLHITLSFVPSMVIVYRNAYHPASYSTSENTTNCYFGIAVGSTYSKAVTTTDTGFRVRNTITTNASTLLNELDGKYTYIAFR